MDIEEEIARTLAAWWYDPDGGTDAEVDAFRPDAAALMPLVKRAQAEALREAAELVMDPRDGLPFNADHDLAIVSAWLDETADRIEQEVEHD